MTKCPEKQPQGGFLLVRGLERFQTMTVGKAGEACDVTPHITTDQKTDRPAEATPSGHQRVCPCL